MCLAAAAAARTYLRGVLGDGVNDVRLRDDWRRRGGLCARHWRVWRGLEAPALSSSVLLRDLLAAALARSDAAAPTPRRRWWRVGGDRAPAAGVPARAARCPACELQRSAERRYQQALARVPAPRLEAALVTGRGFVCVAHLAELPDGPRRRLRARLDDVLTDLDTFLRRSDHRFTHEPMGEAGDAWLRAIRALGGDV